MALRRSRVSCTSPRQPHVAGAFSLMSIMLAADSKEAESRQRHTPCFRIRSPRPLGP